MKKIIAIVLALVLAASVCSSCSIVIHKDERPSGNPDIVGMIPNGLFADNMVIQQGKKVPVFGLAESGLEVTAEFAGQKKTTTAANGHWKVYFDDLQATDEPQTLKIYSDEQSYQYSNILIGEVWLCSGQSNMQWVTKWFSQ